jgi:uncharacterized damage-inducible protein DinB
MKTFEIINQLNEIYTGKPWYGNSVSEIFNSITESGAVQRLVPEGHTIVDLIYHIITWRYFVIKQLQGDKHYDVQQNDINDWRDINYANKDLLKGALSDFDKIHKQLISELSRFNDDQLDMVIPARDYTYEFLLTGLIQHDLYHLGQISLLKSSLSK